MFKPLPLFIGWRYFVSKSGSGLVSFISGLAVTGLVLGVALLVVVMSIMNGFERELKTKILDLVPHVRVYQQNGIENWRQPAGEIARMPGVKSVTPFTRVEGLLTFRGEVVPITVHGEIFGEGNQKLQSYLDHSALSEIEHPIFLSEVVASKLNVETGSRLRLVVPSITDPGQGGSGAQWQSMTVAGIFSTGTEIDQHLAVARLADVSPLAGIGQRAHALQVYLDDVFNARSFRYQLRGILPFNFYSYDWTGSYGNLYHAIKISREMVMLLIFLIVAIAAFNVISMLVMSVTDKKPAIAILKTLGCSRREILKIFFTTGSLIGAMGCMLGGVIGVVLSLNISSWANSLEQALGFKFLNSEVYPVDSLPSELLWTDVLLVLLVAAFINMLATLYPAWKASQTAPADELRYE